MHVYHRQRVENPLRNDPAICNDHTELCACAGHLIEVIGDLETQLQRFELDRARLGVSPPRTPGISTAHDERHVVSGRDEGTERGHGSFRRSEKHEPRHECQKLMAIKTTDGIQDPQGVLPSSEPRTPSPSSVLRPDSEPELPLPLLARTADGSKVI